MSKKVQLVLDDDAVECIEALQAATGASGMSEVLRDALGLYNELFKMTRDKTRTLAMLNRQAGEFQELSVPSFERMQAVRLVSEPVTITAFLQGLRKGTKPKLGGPGLE